MARTIFSVSPYHLEATEARVRLMKHAPTSRVSRVRRVNRVSGVGGVRLTKHAPASAASARQMCVLPVPGGP
eukprot:scaffold131466_cov45-Phaeocystis_antarctica.AAC.1